MGSSLKGYWLLFFVCGAQGHLKRDCPKLKNRTVGIGLPLRLGFFMQLGMQEKRGGRGNAIRDNRMSHNVVNGEYMANKAMDARSFWRKISAKKEEDKSEGKQIKDHIRSTRQGTSPKMAFQLGFGQLEFQAYSLSDDKRHLADKKGHEEHLKAILELLKKGEVRHYTWIPAKIVIYQRLGHLLRYNGEFRQFLGIVGYYRKGFIEGFSRGFSMIAKSMHEAYLRKNQVWTEVEKNKENAF
ncbi:putative reverse transcriptase domain-containing protein [Tanacetum coccineum]